MRAAELSVRIHRNAVGRMFEDIEMTKRLMMGTIVLAIVVLLAGILSAADKPGERVNKHVMRTSVYALPTPAMGADEWTGIADRGAPEAVLGGMMPSVSPGEVLFQSYRDQQHNSTCGRMNDWRPAPAPNGPYAHFGAAFLPAANFNAAQYAYQVWDPVSGSYPNTGGIGCRVQGSGEYGVYVNLMVDPADGAAVISGHDTHTTGGAYHSHVYYDGSPTSCFWGSGSAIPDTMAERISLGATTQMIWPKLAYQRNGSTYVTHLLAYQAGDPVEWGAIAYYRKVGAKAAGTWTGILADSALNGVTPMICASRLSQKVAICWTMNTAQGLVEGPNQVDNDVFYKMSLDMGATWGAKVNVTNYVPNVDGFRAYADLAAMFASDDKLHIMWPARVWPGNAYDPDGTIGFDCRIQHWSENFPAVLSTVASAEWDQVNCRGGSWQLNQTKVAFGDCSGKLYAIWVQFNNIPAGVDDDCASSGAEATSSANGDVWLSVSSDLNGLTWDQARNLTNSYTPDCDTVGGNGPCDSDGWPAINEFGFDLDSLENTYGTLGWPANAKTAVFPSYTGRKYIHLQYINDRFPGNIVVPEGIWTLNPVKWIMMPCVDPVPNPILVIRPTELVYPEWIKHGQQRVVTITMENVGNTSLTVNSITKVQTLPASPSAVNISMTGPVVIPAGIGNTATMTVTLNPGGIINSPGTTVNLRGLVYFKSNSPAPFDSLAFVFNTVITDTLVLPVFDTMISTDSRHRLAVSSNGNMGGQGGGNGRVNLDFWHNGDCDTVDSIPGSTEVYVFDGSPVVIRHTTAPDSVYASWSVFGNSIAEENVFRPVASGADKARDTTVAGQTGWITGKFVTIDTLIDNWKMHILYTVNGSLVHQKHIQLWRVNLHAGATTVQHLTLGEAFDFDVPSDTASYNMAGFDATRNLVYQQGYEYVSVTGKECLKNNRRWAGVAMLGYYSNHDLAVDSCTNKVDMYGGYAALNSDFVYPNDGFVPRELWNNMQNPGYSAEPGQADMHSVLTFKNDLTLGPTDTFYFATAIVTVYDGSLTDLQAAVDEAKVLYIEDVRHCQATCCLGTRGNADGDPDDICDISDLSALVDYLFFGGSITSCLEEADCNTPPDGAVDISDLQALIDFLFFSASLPGC